MEENKDINIHSETADKIIDAVVNSTEQTRNALDTNTSKGVNKFFQLLAATKAGIAIDTYIAERPYKLEQAKQKMLEKYNKIPKENLAEPTPSLCLNVAREFDYYLDEDHIKEMFTNILVSDMDNRKNTKVHPSFINIVKELSKYDAKILELLKNEYDIENFIIRPKYVLEKGFILVNNDIFLINKKDIHTISDIVINTLCRLNLIEIDFLNFKTDEAKYEDAFNELKKHIPPIDLPNFKKIDYDKGILKITKLGQDFIDICLS